MIKDLEKKRYIVNNGIDKAVRKARYQQYALEGQINDLLGGNKRGNVRYIFTGELPHKPIKDLTMKTADLIIDSLDSETLRVADNLNKATYKRRARLSKRIEAMLLSNTCTFLTMTFTDTVLESTNEETRRKYIQRFLKSQFNDYIANIDYGKTTEREHYHGIVTGPVDMSLYKYGFMYCKKIVNPNSKALSKYITKLTYHALKTSTKNNYVIYSRNFSV